MSADESGESEIDAPSRLIENGIVLTADELGTVLNPGWARISGGGIDAVSATPIAAQRAEFANLESRNAGMLIAFAEAVVDAVVDTLRLYTGAARTIGGVPAGEYVHGMTSLFRREPVGVVAAFVPWNVPLLMVAWKLGPAIASGCTLVLRPSQRTPLSALRLAQTVADANLAQPGLFNVVLGRHETVGSTLVQHPDASAPRARRKDT